MPGFTLASHAARGNTIECATRAHQLEAGLVSRRSYVAASKHHATVCPLMASKLVVPSAQRR